MTRSIPLPGRFSNATGWRKSQHARMDHLETLRAFSGIGPERRDAAVADLIELVGAVDGLLQQQAGLDVENLQRYLDRGLSPSTLQEVYAAVLDAKRYTFIASGVTHPNFQELFGAVTTGAQQENVQKALAGILQPAAGQMAVMDLAPVSG